MKNLFMFLAVVLPSFIISGCGDDPATDDSVPVPQPDTTPVTPDKVMDPADQKDFLQKTALEFMGKIPSSDFEELADLGDFAYEKYGDGYNWDTVEDWAESAWKSLRTMTAPGHLVSQDYEYITNYSVLVAASNFTGHFEALRDSWRYTEANDLQFAFMGNDGQQCVAKLTTSGKTQELHIGTIENYTGYEREEALDSWVDYYDKNDVTIKVPETITVTLTKGSKQMVKCVVKTDLSSLTNKEFNLIKSNGNFLVSVDFYNGYSININQLQYTANSKVATSFEMKKGRESLIVISAASDLSGLPSLELGEISYDDTEIDDYDWDNANATNGWVKVDLMGKIQIQGTIKNVRKFIEYLDKADENDTNESTFKSYVNQASSLAQVYVYYNGGTTKQAHLSLETSIDETWNGTTYYCYEPIIEFFDGSKYSTVEAFFNEDDFDSVISTFKRLVNRYCDLIDDVDHVF